MRRYSGGQTDQGEVLDDCYYVTSALKTLRSKGMLLQLSLSSDASSIERRIVEGRWKPGKKLHNPMKRTGEENRETSENILPP